MMSMELFVFLAVVFMTFIAFQLFWDAQLITYPMFRWIQQRQESTFVYIHKIYVKNLGIPTYLPSLLYLVAIAAFLFYRPASIPAVFPVVMNVLNFIGVVSTFGLLVPLHIRIDRTEHASFNDVSRLITYNLIRFGAVIINSLIVLYLLATLLK